MAEEQAQTSNEEPVPLFLITSNTAQQNKRKKLADRRVEEGVSDEARINIGAAFQRWREIRELKGFKTDAEFATFLLDR